MDDNVLHVVSIFNCHKLGAAFNEPLPDPTVRQTVVVCRLLLILQHMYNFSITYEYESIGMELRGAEELNILNKIRNGTIDLYTRAMSLRPELLQYARPVHEIYQWRMGFILRRSDFGLFGSFFRDPFQMPVWYCIYITTIMSVSFFYLLRVCERRLLKCHAEDECSISHEIIVAIAAVCQNSVPTNPTLLSRRAAYATYFMFSYVMYMFYTSNLLYHLVNVRANEMDIVGLANSDYKCVMLNNTSVHNLLEIQIGEEIDLLKMMKFKNTEYVDVISGLESVKEGNTAILSDYLSLYPWIKSTFDDEIWCELIEVDIFSDVSKYIWISKTCKLGEKIKIGILRTLESGILGRITRVREPWRPNCITGAHVRAYFIHIMTPLTFLLATCCMCVIILAAERTLFYRHLPLPYIE